MDEVYERTWRTVQVETSYLEYRYINREEGRAAWEKNTEAWAQQVHRGLREPAEYDMQNCCELSAALGEYTRLSFPYASPTTTNVKSRYFALVLSGPAKRSLVTTFSLHLKTGSPFSEGTS